MGYQDAFDGQRPPWDDADTSGRGRYGGRQASTPRRAGEFRPTDEFWRDEPRRDDHQAGRGDYATSVDAFRPIDPAATGGHQYGMTSDDEGGERRHAREQQDGQRRSRGLLAGGTAGFLAAALAIGVANLVAAFIRPQASPIIVVGGAFIDRTPAALKNFAVEKFGENDKNVLLLSLYVTIAIIAILVGMIAWRHVWAGVAGIGAFGAFGAYVAYTRPESHLTDVIPSLAGGIAGIVAIALLVTMTRRRAGGAPEASTESRLTTARSGWSGGTEWSRGTGLSRGTGWAG